MGNNTIFESFENPGRGRQERNFTTNVPKILDVKSSSEHRYFPKLALGVPDISLKTPPENKMVCHYNIE